MGCALCAVLEFMPGRFPMVWVLEYHPASQEMASQVAKRIQDIARAKGEESLVRVTLEPTTDRWNVDQSK